MKDQMDISIIFKSNYYFIKKGKQKYIQHVVIDRKIKTTNTFPLGQPINKSLQRLFNI